MIRKLARTTKKALQSVLPWFFSAILLLIAVLSKSLPPRDFPVGEILAVQTGDSVRTIARNLEDKGYVRSAEWFMLLLKMRSSTAVIVSGDYLFDRPVSAYGVVDRLSHGKYGPTQIRLTLPEGGTIQQFAEIASGTIPNFDAEKFVELAEDKEGYLFPDTYQVFPSVTPKDLIAMMEENFTARVIPLFEEHDIPEEDRADLITLASIVEREAFGDNYEEHQVVAGILKKRLDIGMALQVDATLFYERGKTSSQLKISDLREDSPYNTYTNRGLPPGPIANPGVLAIETTILSKESPYLFYLHGSDGRIHYATTHDEHVANKRRYLK